MAVSTSPALGGLHYPINPEADFLAKRLPTFPSHDYLKHLFLLLPPRKAPPFSPFHGKFLTLFDLFPRGPFTSSSMRFVGEALPFLIPPPPGPQVGTCLMHLTSAMRHFLSLLFSCFYFTNALVEISRIPRICQSGVVLILLQSRLGRLPSVPSLRNQTSPCLNSVTNPSQSWVSSPCFLPTDFVTAPT